MEHTSIFKPTPKFKELLILNLLTVNKNMTQREIANKVETSVAMVNSYLEKFQIEGLIIKKYITKKQIEYSVTKKGMNRIKLLEISYMESAIEVFEEAKKELTSFLLSIQQKYKNIILYGAGEVASTILFVIDATPNIKLNVLAIIDDSEEKIGKEKIGKLIINFTELKKYRYDCILISSYDHEKKIFNKLKENNINNIIRFFE